MCECLFVQYLLCVCVDLSKVCGVDLSDASHEQAVEAIRRAGDSVLFLVQSGQHRSQVLHLRTYGILRPLAAFESESLAPSGVVRGSCVAFQYEVLWTQSVRSVWKHTNGVHICSGRTDTHSPSLSLCFPRPQSPTLAKHERLTPTAQSNSHSGKVTLWSPHVWNVVFTKKVLLCVESSPPYKNSTKKKICFYVVTLDFTGTMTSCEILFPQFLFPHCYWCLVLYGWIGCYRHTLYIYIYDESLTPTWYSQRNDVFFLRGKLCSVGAAYWTISVFPLLVVGSRDSQSVPYPLPYKPLHSHPL